MKKYSKPEIELIEVDLSNNIMDVMFTSAGQGTMSKSETDVDVLYESRRRGNRWGDYGD